MAQGIIGSGNNQVGIVTDTSGNRAFVVKMENRSGITMNQGQLVQAHNGITEAFDQSTADGSDHFGVVWDSSIANLARGLIAIAGIAEVKMEDNTAATIGYWVRSAVLESGYSNATNAAAPIGSVANLDTHFKQVGYCLETVVAGGPGTYINAKCMLCFN